MIQQILILNFIHRNIIKHFLENNIIHNFYNRVDMELTVLDSMTLKYILFYYIFMFRK